MKKNIKDNTVNINGIDVYEHKIYQLCDEYIERLKDPSDIKSRITFNGMLRYIYQNLFKPTQDMIIYNNRSSILDYSDINLLMDIYNIFIDICALYKKEYTKNRFITMTGISNDTLDNWKKGRKIPAVEGVPSSVWVAFAEKIKENSEQALSDSMLDGNLMAYAQLKCWYGWREEPQRIEMLNNGELQQSKEEIAAQYPAFKNLPEPEKPDGI